MANEIGYEIDFLPVGNGERSGDAIAVRYGTPGNYKVMVYDGGTKESGQALVDHIKKYYQTTRVDYMVNSHPDADHSSGLSVVLEQLDVRELWMHRPWEHSAKISDYFNDGRITDESLAERLKAKMAAAYALEKLAMDKGIPIYEPFRGAMIGDFVVLSPEQHWYLHTLVPEFEKSPEQKKQVVDAALSLLLKSMAEAAGKIVTWIAEQWGIETLRENVETSAENESSVVLYGVIDSRGILLTGDAGVRALTATADFTESSGVSLPADLRFAQIPHHGSRHNVSTSVLDRVIGPRKPTDDGATTKTAFVSAGKDSTTHPRKMVVNAFLRRGAKVVATQGETKRHSHKMPPRDGWIAATPLSFSNQVESWD